MISSFDLIALTALTALITATALTVWQTTNLSTTNRVFDERSTTKSIAPSCAPFGATFDTVGNNGLETEGHPPLANDHDIGIAR